MTEVAHHLSRAFGYVVIMQLMLWTSAPAIIGVPFALVSLWHCWLVFSALKMR